MCGLCGRPIMPGDLYMYHFGVDDGDTFIEREHVCCHNMMVEYCGKCPDQSEGCWDSDCLEHALIDSVCDGCKDKACPNLPSRCDKIWDLAKAKYGEVKP